MVLVTGGEPVKAARPRHVRQVRLPGLMMDEEFSDLFPARPGADLETVKANRKRLLWETLDRGKTGCFS